MHKRTLINLGLLGCVLLLALVVIVEPGHTPPAVDSPLLKLTRTQVARLRIERPGRDTVVVQRRGDGWFMTAPLAGPANTPLITELLKITTVVCPLHYSIVELDLAKLQLDPPLLRLMVNDQALAFGGTEALEQRRYVRIGDTVYLCLDRFFYLLNGDVSNFTAAAGEPQ